MRLTRNELYILIFFFFFWLFASFFYILVSDFSPTVLSYDHTRENPSFVVSENILQGSFVAQENYLGIVSISFTVPDQILKDKVSFKVKYEGSNEVISENVYNLEELYQLKEFPLGIPTIKDSKGKKFEFELISDEHTISEIFSPKNPGLLVVTKYQYPKSLLVKKPLILFDFVKKKILFTIHTQDFRKKTFVYMIPFIVFFAYIFIRSNQYISTLVNENTLLSSTKFFFAEQKNVINRIIKSNVGLTFVVLLTANIFIIPTNYFLLTVVTILLFIFLLYTYNISYRFIFTMAGLLLTLAVVSQTFSLETIPTKLSDWAYYFLIVATFRALINTYVKKS